MKHSDFKEAARRHQIDFKVNDPEINVLASRYPIRKITRNDKTTVVHVESSLEWRDVRDENGNYRIFFSGFREEITKEVDKPTTQLSNQMVTNLLRSEHIPYNLFFPMMKDPEGTATLFNRILGEERIAKIEKILIEHNPGGLKDGTSFDTYVEYIPAGAKTGEKGAIGIEVKYTEKEYPIKKELKSGTRPTMKMEFILPRIIVFHLLIAVGSSWITFRMCLSLILKVRKSMSLPINIVRSGEITYSELLCCSMGK